MLNFSRLIYPLSAQLFVGEYWQKRPLIVRDRDRDYYAELVKIADIDRIIYSLQPDWKKMRLIKKGGFFAQNFLNPDGSPNLISIYNAYQRGYTIVLYQLEQRWPSISALARNLEDFFNFPVDVNGYLTPAHSHALIPHFDWEDVLILQVEGIKQWRIYEPLSPPELTTRKLAGDTTLYQDTLPPLAMEVCLEPGDFLYLPGGWGHEAFTTTASSLHLTAGVHAYTWRDLLSAVLSSLRSENSEFRRALPPGFLRGGKIQSEQLERLFQIVAENGNLDSAIEGLKHRLLARTPNPLPSGDFQRLDRANLEATLTRQFRAD